MKLLGLNSKWTVKRDEHCWHLTEKREVIAATGPRKGQSIETESTTYHATLGQAMRHCADREAGYCQTLAEAIERINSIYAGPCHLEEMAAPEPKKQYAVKVGA